jgi:hypothetical protein
VNHRTYFPDWPPRYYRLRVQAPLTVTFPSVAYELTLQSVQSAGRHELVAHDAKTGLWPTVSPAYYSRDKLELAVFHTGFPVRPASIAEVIMRKLVREKRADLVS